MFIVICLLVNIGPGFSNKLCGQPFQGFWQICSVHPLSALPKPFPNTVLQETHLVLSILLLPLLAVWIYMVTHSCQRGEVPKFPQHSDLQAETAHMPGSMILA